MASMLPIDIRDGRVPTKSTRVSDSKFPKYFRRLIDFRQMDFEATFDQMITLLSTEPDNV